MEQETKTEAQTQQTGQLEQAAHAEQTAQVEFENRNLNYVERQEIKELSKMFLGSPSRWQKLVNEGSLVPQKDSEGNPIVIGINKKIRDKDGKPTPVHVYDRVRVNALKLLSELRNAKAMVDASREKQRQEKELRDAATEASGVAEGPK